MRQQPDKRPFYLFHTCSTKDLTEDLTEDLIFEVLNKQSNNSRIFYTRGSLARKHGPPSRGKQKQKKKDTVLPHLLQTAPNRQKNKVGESSFDGVRTKRRRYGDDNSRGDYD